MSSWASIANEKPEEKEEIKPEEIVSKKSTIAKPRKKFNIFLVFNTKKNNIVSNMDHN